MQNISREAVERLIESQDQGSDKLKVTIYSPMQTSSAPQNMPQNQIRLKNAISRACEQLRKHDANSRLASELEVMLDRLYDDLEFWKFQTPGLLLCARTGDVRLFDLPVDTDEYVAVDDSFHLAPVLAMLQEIKPFYVLKVDQHNPKLFRGDMFSLRIAGIGLPASIHDALSLDEMNQKSENQVSANGSSLNTGWFNGRGGARNPQEEDRMKFFRIIDRIINEKDKLGLPMILAGIDAETSEYRNLSKYPHILQGTVSGGHADLDMDELLRKALAIIQQELIEPVHAAAVEEYERLEGANPDRTAHDLKTIESAIEQGRVDKLLATMGRETTDNIRDGLVPVHKITFLDGDRSRQLNRLALKVWRMSGTVINLTPHEMPHGAPIVARLRY